jgi:hypothetical protein
MQTKAASRAGALAAALQGVGAGPARDRYSNVTQKGARHRFGISGALEY